MSMWEEVNAGIRKRGRDRFKPFVASCWDCDQEYDLYFDGMNITCGDCIERIFSESDEEE